jgi:hypothetical protein
MKAMLKLMSRDEIEKLCLEKGWKLPTLEDINKNIENIEYKDFWIEGYANDPDPETGEDKMHPLFYNNGVIETLNKNFKINVIIMKEEPTCPNCGHLCHN